MENNWSQDKYIHALKFAAIAHNEQPYPRLNLPYLYHLNLVSMEIIAALNHTPDANGNLAIQCALLHDTIEDTGTSYEDLENGFGIAVADGVKALSKNDSLKEEDTLNDSLKRIKEQPKEIWMVKLADRIANMQKPPENWNTNKIEMYYKDAILIYNSLKEASPFLASRLKSKIEEYRSYI